MPKNNEPTIDAILDAMQGDSREGRTVVFIDSPINREDPFFKSLIGTRAKIEVCMGYNGAKFKTPEHGWFSAWNARFKLASDKPELIAALREAVNDLRAIANKTGSERDIDNILATGALSRIAHKLSGRE